MVYGTETKLQFDVPKELDKPHDIALVTGLAIQSKKNYVVYRLTLKISWEAKASSAQFGNIKDAFAYNQQDDSDTTND
ncbi:hypothetical protein llap_11534 [Limosa lapponica baueri]|uniref:Uncharacterized protein n=1 Tax=Limosa lapponica baueri TaxID=1758121 RepID=A0A2I0TWL4_LIMLA|nr:hypothetical protein llap_11534 [Limosa lapponica baueri]